MSYQELPIASESDYLDQDILSAIDDALASEYIDEWMN